MLEEANVEERQLKLLVDSPMRKGLLNLFAGMTGIVGFCFGLMPIIGVFFFPFSVMAIVFGALGKGQREYRRLGLAGMALGIVAILFQAILVVLAVWGTLFLVDMIRI